MRLRPLWTPVPHSPPQQDWNYFKRVIKTSFLAASWTASSSPHHRAFMLPWYSPTEGFKSLLKTSHRGQAHRHLPAIPDIAKYICYPIYCLHQCSEWWLCIPPLPRQCHQSLLAWGLSAWLTQAPGSYTQTDTHDFGFLCRSTSPSPKAYPGLCLSRSFSYT